MLTEEEIVKNWEKCISLAKKCGDRAGAFVTMLEALENRLAIAPASAKKEYHNAFPGGLIEHSLRVLKNAIAIRDAFDWELPNESLIIAAICHDLGKLGDEEKDYYVEQKDTWRAEKLGEVFAYNKEIQYMTVPDRGVWLCQHFGVKLTKDETLAIKLNDGMYIEANKPYALKEPLLAYVIHVADVIATRQEKGDFL